MKFLYDIALQISGILLQIFGNFFGQKVRYFRQGQQQVFKKLATCLQTDQPVIWFHVASLGEYEQALPVILQMKENYPDKQILLSFFSPSGYEIKKDKTPADCVVYLPLDTPANARKFINKVKPETVFFVKYDLWPNYLKVIQQNQIPTYLISAYFYEGHRFLKKKWLQEYLKAFKHFFAQNKETKKLLEQHGFNNVSLTGDTRFDRVYQIAQTVEDFPFVTQFKQNSPLLIAGSTWPADEKLLLDYIHSRSQKFKTIIAPHEVHAAHIENITRQLKKPYILYTEIKEDTDLTAYDVLIVNTIGILNKIYRYADVVYIGNGFGKSIHNIQEPAVYGVPIITGPHIQKFKEATDLHQLGGLSVVHNQRELNTVLDNLLSNKELRQQQGTITKQYAMQNVGATDKIMTYLKQNL